MAIHYGPDLPEGTPFNMVLVLGKEAARAVRYVDPDSDESEPEDVWTEDDVRAAMEAGRAAEVYGFDSEGEMRAFGAGTLVTDPDAEHSYAMDIESRDALLAELQAWLDKQEN